MANLVDDNNWVSDLENALLEECCATDIYCICRGKTLPENLRPEVWQICLDVRDKGNQLDHFNEVFDLPNQSILREDCSKLRHEEEDKLSVVSDLESILTFYCKCGNLKYERNNGWIDVLLPLLALKVPRSTTYNLFEAIRDTYIPQTLNRKSGNAFHVLRLLLLYHDPELCSFLDTKRITPDMYGWMWFQSLFAATCSLPVVINMWDYYFQQSDPFFIFFLSLTMVINAREQIISMKNKSREAIAASLSNMPCTLEADNVENFCSLAQDYKMKTPTSFRLMQALYSGQGEDTALVSQALCLPISVYELVENSGTLRSNNMDAVHFFLVDCRPVEQYNSSRLPTAFHLDCNLMLQEPSAFTTAVQGLLSCQKQAGGEHLCFLGSGRNEEDQYAHMMIASFLQKHTRYVSLLTGGYTAIHNYFGNQVDEYLQDHNSTTCIVCSPMEVDYNSKYVPSSDLFGKISAAMKSKSAKVKRKLFDYIVNPNNNAVQERHVSSSDKMGKQYRNVGTVFSISDVHDNVTCIQGAGDDEAVKEIVSLGGCLKNSDVVEHFPCHEVELDGFMYKSHLVVTQSHLMVLREVPDSRGLAEIIVRRPFFSIIRITKSTLLPDLIMFVYGICSDKWYQIYDGDRLLISNANKAMNVIAELIYMTPDNDRILLRNQLYDEIIKLKSNNKY